MQLKSNFKMVWFEIWNSTNKMNMFCKLFYLVDKMVQKFQKGNISLGMNFIQQ